MTLPLLKSLPDCGDYQHTVEPFLPQLYELPRRVLENISSLDGLAKVYAETNPFVSGLGFSIFLGAVFLVVAEVNQNFSQVDRMWSILPLLYTLHMDVWARVWKLPHDRLDLLVAFAAIWSVRLTINYWRKGGYQIGSEDYRWNIVKKNIPGWMFFLLDATFISFMQSVLIYLFSSAPAYTILVTTQVDPHISASDIFYFVTLVALVFSEWISDGQQWNYQTAKHQYLKDAKVPHGFQQADLDRGFLTSGLWAYSRHPNFFAEQTIWIVLYQWGCYATQTVYNWSGIGAGSLVLLFQGSTWLTELITSGKYPEYKHYQKQVGMFVPKSLSGYHPPQATQRSSISQETKKGI